MIQGHQQHWKSKAHHPLNSKQFYFQCITRNVVCAYFIHVYMTYPLEEEGGGGEGGLFVWLVGDCFLVCMGSPISSLLTKFLDLH